MAANPAAWPHDGRGGVGGEERVRYPLGRRLPAGGAATAAAAALPPDLTFEIRFALMGLALHSIIQLRELPTSVGSEVWQRLGSILLFSLLYLAQVLTPALYVRRRDAIVSAIKFCFFCFPLLRRPRGHVQKALDWPATPGLRGVAVDLLRVTWGERGLR